MVRPRARRRAAGARDTVVGGPHTGGMTTAPLVIDCDTCAMRHTDACADCLVTFLCEDDERVGAVVIDAAEARAMTLLTRAGLAPALRHRRAG